MANAIYSIVLMNNAEAQHRCLPARCRVVMMTRDNNATYLWIEAEALDPKVAQVQFRVERATDYLAVPDGWLYLGTATGLAFIPALMTMENSSSHVLWRPPPNVVVFDNRLVPRPGAGQSMPDPPPPVRERDLDIR